MRPRQLDRCVPGIARRVYGGDNKCRKRVGAQPDEAIDKHFGKTRKLLSTPPVDMKMKWPAVQYSCLQHLDPSGKIKLQLYPLDADTRMRLEKDGHNPHLELTLKARKTISSVLKHIKAKWGSSVDTGGEPVLVPYKAKERARGSNKWTSEDIEVTAGDVYAAIGCPAIFRLRYGWLPVENHVSKLSHSPFTQCLHCLSAEEACQQCEGLETDFGNNHNSAHSEREKAEMTNKDARLAVDMMVAPQQSAEQHAKAETVLGGAKQLAAWYDSLTNISIGGIFSEASLQGRPSNFNSKIYGIRVEPSFPPSQCTSDSFDALLRGFQTQMVPSNDTCLSIFDAEDTCMEFPFRKSSGEDTGEVTENSCLKLSNQLKLSEGFSNQESRLLLCSALNNGESSLGLSGIKWTNTLGPFDLDLPSRKVVTEDANGTGQGDR